MIVCLCPPEGGAASLPARGNATQKPSQLRRSSWATKALRGDRRRLRERRDRAGVEL